MGIHEISRSVVQAIDKANPGAYADQAAIDAFNQMLFSQVLTVVQFTVLGCAEAADAIVSQSNIQPRNVVGNMICKAYGLSHHDREQFAVSRENHEAAARKKAAEEQAAAEKALLEMKVEGDAKQ